MENLFFLDKQSSSDMIAGWTGHPYVYVSLYAHVNTVELLYARRSTAAACLYTTDCMSAGLESSVCLSVHSDPVWLCLGFLVYGSVSVGVQHSVHRFLYRETS